MRWLNPDFFKRGKRVIAADTATLEELDRNLAAAPKR